MRSPAKDNIYDEVHLLQLTANGDEVAFRHLFDLYRTPVFNFAMHYTKDVQASEEIVQETFMKIWTQREKLPLVRRLETWIFVVVRNKCYDHLRKLARQAALERSWSSSQPVEEPSPDEWYESREYAILLDQAIDQLPAQQKLVYELYRQGSLQQDEIASTLGLSLPTVKTHLSLARKSITHYLRDNIDLAVFIGFFCSI